MRRLFRLVIGLALVVVVMKQASRESLYRPFFASVVDSAVDSAVADSSSAIQTTDASSVVMNVTPEVVSVIGSGEDFRAAIDRVVDGSVWRGEDFDAFYQALKLAQSGFFDSGGTVVGVLPLLQQPDVFRGQVVSIAGTVARAEKLPAKENEFGIESYWQLWLRPEGGADRPIVAIVNDVPSHVAIVGPGATIEDGPAVNVTGVFLKRLAYRSGAGADLAPVVIGQLMTAPSPTELASNADATNVPTSLAWTAIAACLIGVTIAGLVSWRTSVMAERGRELRLSGSPRRVDFAEPIAIDPVPNPKDDRE